jgi:hypothetical protein
MGIAAAIALMIMEPRAQLPSVGPSVDPGNLAVTLATSDQVDLILASDDWKFGRMTWYFEVLRFSELGFIAVERYDMSRVRVPQDMIPRRDIYIYIYIYENTFASSH